MQAHTDISIYVCLHERYLSKKLFYTCVSALFRQRQFENGAVGMFFQNDVLHFLDDVWMLGSDVVVFVQVCCEVVKTALPSLHHQFPVAHAQAHHVCLMKFPIEVVVLLLFALSGQSGIEGDAVEIIVGKRFVAVALLVVFNASQIAERWHEVVEGQLMVVDRSGLDVAWPAYDEGDANAALVGAAFLALKQTVAVEEIGVGAAFLMRSVVRREDNDGVLVEALLLQFGHNLPHLRIQTRNHASKLRMTVVRWVIARTLVTAEGFLLTEVSLIGQEDRVFRLSEFGMRQGIGEDAEKRLVFRLLIEPFKGLLVDDVGRILWAFLVFLTKHGIFDVLFQHFATHALVASRAAVGVQEVRIIEVGLKLANETIVFVNAALVGRGHRTLVAAGPLAEHTGGIAVVFEDFRNDDVSGVIRFLSHHGEIGVVAIFHHVVVSPILLVATNMRVARMLARHKRCTRRGRHRTARIGLRESHTLGGEAVNVGR